MTNMVVSHHAIYLINEGKCIETYEFQIFLFFPFFHVFEPSHMTCKHGQRVQGEEQ